MSMLHKPMGYGVSADLSYAWSRLKDDMDSSGWGNQFGSVYYQDPFHPSANYAVSNFDRPNSFKGLDRILAIPLGRGHQYLNSALADAAIGGWQASTSFIAESGAPFTVVMIALCRRHAGERACAVVLVSQPGRESTCVQSVAQ